MASGGAPIVTTREIVNYARLCRLLIDVGSEVLRDTFNRIHSPAKLSEVLSHPSIKSILLGKKGKKQEKGKRALLNETQEKELYPTSSNMSVNDLDIKILMILLRNICKLSAPSSTGSWEKFPPASDNSLEANIVRIKLYGKKVYAHAKKAPVDDATFNKLWLNISYAILALGESQASVIDRLKTESMDPDVQERYQRALEEWVKSDVSIKEELQGMKGMQTLLKHLKTISFCWCRIMV